MSQVFQGHLKVAGVPDGARFAQLLNSPAGVRWQLVLSFCNWYN